MLKPFTLGVHDLKKDDLAEAVVLATNMRKLGHAIDIDVTYNASNEFQSARVTHFLTCKACQKGEK